MIFCFDWLIVGMILYLQIRTHSIRKAHENIDKTLKVAEVLLAQFDISHQVGFTDFLLFPLFIRSPRIVSCSFFFTLNVIVGISRTLGARGFLFFFFFF